MTRNQKTALAIGLAAISMLFVLAALSPAHAASNKLPVVQTYQPPLGVDAGCGKGKPVYTVGGKKFCSIPKGGAK